MSEQRLPVFEAQASLTGTFELQGYAATLDLMNNDISFDAIFAASDGLAVGAMQALNKCGRVIPEDVAVIGFDGVGFAPYTIPPLSTVEQNGAVAGSYLVEALLRMIAGEDYQLPAVLVKPIWRASSRASSTKRSSMNQYYIKTKIDV